MGGRGTQYVEAYPTRWTLVPRREPAPIAALFPVPVAAVEGPDGRYFDAGVGIVRDGPQGMIGRPAYTCALPLSRRGCTPCIEQRDCPRRRARRLMTIATPDLKHFATHGGWQRPGPFPITPTGIDGQFLLNATGSVWKKETCLRHRGKVELTHATRPENAQQRKKSSAAEVSFISF